MILVFLATWEYSPVGAVIDGGAAISEPATEKADARCRGDPREPDLSRV